MKLTYKKLLNLLQQFTPEQLESEVVVYLPWDEYEYQFIHEDFWFASEGNEKLDEGHPILYSYEGTEPDCPGDIQARDSL